MGDISVASFCLYLDFSLTSRLNFLRASSSGNLAIFCILPWSYVAFIIGFVCLGDFLGFLFTPLKTCVFHSNILAFIWYLVDMEGSLCYLVPAKR